MEQLDTRHLLCPMPVIRTQDKINNMQAGEQLQVICTDPGALNDVPTWCRINGHTVVSTREENGEIFIQIKVGPHG